MIKIKIFIVSAACKNAKQHDVELYYVPESKLSVLNQVFRISKISFECVPDIQNIF
jgi:hypothetical protein